MNTIQTFEPIFDNFEDLQQYNLSFINGEINQTTYHYGPLDEETLPYRDTLYALNKLGFITVCSQPGHLNCNGIRQKPFLEFYMKKDWFPFLAEMEQTGYQFYVSDEKEQCVYSSIEAPHVITQTISGFQYTWLPDNKTINTSFNSHFGSWSSQNALKNTYLVQMLYPRFSNKDIFSDLYHWALDFNKYLEMLGELKQNCKFLGLSGNMGAGKDYIIDHYILPFFQHHQNFKINKIAFANQLKIEGIVSHQLQPEKVFGRRDAHTRSSLQKIGTEEGRDKRGKNIWLKYFISWCYLQYQTNGTNLFVVSDCRFDNECDIIYKLGGKILNVYAPKRTERRQQEEGSNLSHSSEGINKLPFDLQINNDATVNVYQLYYFLESYLDYKIHHISLPLEPIPEEIIN